MQHFWKKYKKYIYEFGIITLVIFGVIYGYFLYFLKSKAITSSDWLAFWGVYLSFIGTIAVSAIAVGQGHIYNEEENQRRRKERFENIQPVFAIKLEKIDGQLKQVVDQIDPYGHNTQKRKHKNFTISIKIINDNQIMNVCVYDKYIFSVMEPDHTYRIQFCYNDSPDVVLIPKSNRISEGQGTVILSRDIDRDLEGIATCLSIVYDDIDGNSCVQTFNLKKYDDTEAYSLENSEGLHFQSPILLVKNAANHIMNMLNFN